MTATKIKCKPSTHTYLWKEICTKCGEVNAVQKTCGAGKRKKELI